MGYENCWLRQCQTTHNTVVERFDHYIATHQSSNKPPDEPVSAMKRYWIDEKLFTTFLPYNFPEIFNSSSKVSPTVTFANTAHTLLPAPGLQSDVTDNNNSNASTDKTTRTEISDLSTAVLTLETMVQTIQNQQQTIKDQQYTMQKQLLQFEQDRIDNQKC